MPNPPARENGDLDGDLIEEPVQSIESSSMICCITSLSNDRRQPLSGAGNALAVYRDTDAVSGDVPVTDGARRLREPIGFSLRTVTSGEE
jgi:hypothetical protein